MIKVMRKFVLLLETVVDVLLKGVEITDGERTKLFIRFNELQDSIDEVEKASQ